MEVVELGGNTGGMENVVIKGKGDFGVFFLFDKNKKKKRKLTSKISQQ